MKKRKLSPRDHNRAAYPPNSPARMAMDENIPLINKAFGLDVKQDTRKSKVVTFRTTEFLYKQIEALAKDCGVSQSTLIEDMVAQVLMEVSFTVDIFNALKSVCETQGESTGAAILEAERTLPERIQFFNNAYRRVDNMEKMLNQQGESGEAVPE